MADKKILNYLKDLNREHLLTEDDIIPIKQYYLSMYRQYMVHMYDQGYISDPTVFNEKEIRGNLVDFGIVGVISTYGELVLSSDSIRYASHKRSVNSEHLDFLILLEKTLRYREYCRDLDNFYEFYKVSGRLKLWIMGGRIENKWSPRVTKPVARLYSDINKTIEWVGFTSLVKGYILEELGLPLDTRMDEELSLEEEESLFEFLYDGSFPRNIDSELSNKIKNWKKENKGKSILDHVCMEKGTDLLNNVCNLANSYDYKDVVMLESFGVYIQRERRVNYCPSNLFTVLGGDEDREVNMIPERNGYTGEAYTPSYLESEGFHAVGVPVIIHVNDDEVKVFDREQTDIPFDSWFKANDLDFVF